MGVFDDYPIAWNGKNYVIPAGAMLGAIARIEDVVTLQELFAYGLRGKAPMAKLARAYGAVLRYAGAALTDEEVYKGIVTGDQPHEAVVNAINGLLGMMLPPSMWEAGKEHKPGNSRKGARRSSKRSTKRSSARAG